MRAFAVAAAGEEEGAAVKLKPHPLADLIPPMSEAEFAALKHSIEADGLVEPITLYDEKILDGRHRYRACAELGIEPKTRAYRDGGEEDSALAFVLAKNLHRRHLSESQRAMIAAKLATLKRGQKKSDVKNSTSQGDAAAMLNVSRPTVNAAKRILDSGTPELVAAVERGEIAVSAARSIAKLPKRDQVKIAEETDSKKRRELSRSAKAERPSEKQQQEFDLQWERTGLRHELQLRLNRWPTAHLPQLVAELEAFVEHVRNRRKVA